MRQSMNLQQKIETKYLLTPLLKQSLDILKYSMQELEDYVKEVATNNPLIEITQNENHFPIEMARVKSDKRFTDSFNTDLHESYDVINQLASQDETLELYLMEQLALKKNLSKTEKEVILYYIRSLDDVGYLDCDLEEVSVYFQLPRSECEKMLSVLQSFEPVGIGARNLSECLLLQLNRKKDVPRLALPFIEEHLEDLANRKFQLLANKYKITKEEVQAILSFIQTLQPRPLIVMETTKTEFIIPDIIIEEFQGDYIIRVNDTYLPQVSINTYYEELLRTDIESQTQDYLKTKLSDAVLLMKGIEHRHETLYKVTKEILKHQTEFLKKGETALKPLQLKDIAEILELHESTVSRAVRNKYIQAPQGIYPLKTLFMRGLKVNGGTVESTIRIKERIKSIIQTENPKKPISDQKIANVLLGEGIQIARRTVTKYREELGILQSTKRAQKP